MRHKEINNYKYNIYVIRIDESINILTYSYMFSPEINKEISSYKKHTDKLTAFTSALLKYYYLPYILGINPREIIIKVNKYGKPYIVNLPEVDFNISHSGKYAVLGIAYGGKIGVDIEKIDNTIELSLGSIAFNSYEANQIGCTLDFYLLWVKKEAYLKCVGEGFATDLYKETMLTTELIQVESGNNIYANIFSREYVLAICITK